jgi:dihydrofolate reductase
MVVSLVVAVAENGVIGRENALPWHLPDDLRHFKRMTIGRPVIMGRKTFESIGRPLPKRMNIVVSRNKDFTADGVTVAHSLREALDLATRPSGNGEVAVIGGAALFAEALPLADRLYLTEVHDSPEGDVFFPEFDRSAWETVDEKPGEPDEQGRRTHTFLTLRRK